MGGRLGVAQIVIYCPDHVKRDERNRAERDEKTGKLLGKGNESLRDPETGLLLARAMEYDALKHGWVCRHVYGPGERGRYARRCETRYGFGYVFEREDAAVLLEMGMRVEQLRLSDEIMTKWRRGEAVIPWVRGRRVERRRPELTFDQLDRLMRQTPRTGRAA